MAFDPLSSSTRRSRTGLLVFSAAGFLVSTFEIRLTDVSLSGIDLDFPESFLDFTTFAGFCYFALTFAVSYTDDIINSDRPEYVARIERKKQEYVDQFREKLREQFTDKRSQIFSSFSGADYRLQDARRIDILNKLLKEISLSDLENGQIYSKIYYRVVKMINELFARRSPPKEMVNEVAKRVREIAENVGFTLNTNAENSIAPKGLGRYSRFLNFRTYGVEAGLPVIIGLAYLATWFDLVSFRSLVDWFTPTG